MSSTPTDSITQQSAEATPASHGTPFDPVDISSRAFWALNQQVAFGGGGPPYCLDAVLARMQIRHTLEQILRRIPELHLGAPDMLVSNFATAVKHMDAHSRCPIRPHAVR